MEEEEEGVSGVKMAYLTRAHSPPLYRLSLTWASSRACDPYARVTASDDVTDDAPDNFGYGAHGQGTPVSISARYATA